MSRSLRNFPFILALVVGCATMPPQNDTAVRPAIERQAAAWGEAVSRGDADAAVALYTEDAILMAPNVEPIRGSGALRGFFNAVRGMSPRDVRLTVEDVETCGDTAIELGSYTMSLQPAGQDRFTDRGKYMVVWKRQADGSWRIHRDIFNTNLPMH